MTGQNSFWFANPSTGFYNGVINQSARFNDDDNAYLNDTSPQSGNRRTFTVSCWIKRNNLGGYQSFYSAGTTGNNFTLFNFHTDDTLYLEDYISSSQYRLVTNQVFRDTTNWYHIVIAFDTTQATDSDRIKLYVNGSQVTSFDTETYPSQNYDTFANTNLTNNNISIGAYSNNLSTTNYRLDAYLAEYNFIDGTAYTPTTFGETKNGVWIPKAISGVSYGTNGFRLTFADTSNLGDDTSGNGNDFAVNGLASTDVVLDSPENNFCTINGIRESTVYNGSVTFSEGNLQSVDAGTTYSLHWTGTFGMSTGKWYWEVLAHTMGGSAGNIGICNSVHRVATAGTGVFYSNDGKRNAVSYLYGTTTYGDSYTNGDIIGVAFDADNETVTFYKNNSSQGAVGSVLTTANGPYFAAAGDGQNATTYKYVANWGQDSSFAGNKTAQGNQDENGVGDFYYAPPSGYLALCSSNLPDTTLSPDENVSDEKATDYFNTVLWTGTGNTTQDITGVGFRPDWCWIKNRNTAVNHYLLDSSRGLNAWSTNTSSAESSSANRFNSFDSDGFQVEHSGGGNGFTNGASQTYVGWNWRLNGGTTSEDTNGTKTTAVQFNSTAGISIATYTNASQGNHTFGHGLGSKPEAFIWKARNTTMNWIWWDVYNFTDADRNGKYVNSTIGFTSGSNWVTDVTDTTINITDGQVSSGNNINYWCISFKSVEGFSKIANYTGNGSTDGTFIYLGFRPAWFLLKRIDNNANWLIYDNKRDPDNRVAQGLFPNLNSAETEQTGGFVDFVSNGVKLREDGSAMNASGGTFVYIAFAEQPFKFSNAR